MKRSILAVAAIAALAACSEGGTAPTDASLARSGSGNPHFVASATGAEVNPTPSLRVFFKEAGVGAGATVTIRAQARAVAVLACVNGGDNQPSDRKKHKVSGTVSASGQFTASAGGNVVDSHTLAFPAAAALLSCPNGQVSTLLGGYWDLAGVFDDTNGESLDIPGQFNVAP